VRWVRATKGLWRTGGLDECTPCRRATSKPLLFNSPHDGPRAYGASIRISGESKLVGVGDAEVTRDIYTVFSADGLPDTIIEDDILCGIEGAFCSARHELLNHVFLKRTPLSKERFGTAGITSGASTSRSA
jgi:hypothetical protein